MQIQILGQIESKINVDQCFSEITHFDWHATIVRLFQLCCNQGIPRKIKTKKTAMRQKASMKEPKVV